MKQGPVGNELLSLFDFAFERLTNRLKGLTDEEYLWQLAPGCWTVRVGGLDGDLNLPEEERPPGRFTTIAWRLCHLSNSIARHPFNGFLQAGWTASPERFPLTADSGQAYLRQSFQEWRDLLGSVQPRAWTRPLGAAAVPYADATVLGVALHNADEFIHHAAEVALLRDLYAQRAALRT